MNPFLLFFKSYTTYLLSKEETSKLLIRSIFRLKHVTMLIGYILFISYSNPEPLSKHTSLKEDMIDTDGDGVPDSIDIDDDNDGILDEIERDNSCTTITPDGKTNYIYFTSGHSTGWHDMIPFSGLGGDKPVNAWPDVDEYGLPVNNSASIISKGTVKEMEKPLKTDSGSKIDCIRWDGWLIFPSDLWGNTIKIRVSPPNLSVVGAGGWVISPNTNPSDWIDPVDPATRTPLLDMKNTTNFSNPKRGWNKPPVGYTDHPKFEDNTKIPDPRGNPQAFVVDITVNQFGHFIAKWQTDPINIWQSHKFQYSTDEGKIWKDIPNAYFSSTSPCTKIDRDTDKDGIPDHLDLDSDGDGCPDIMESEVKDYLIKLNLSSELVSGKVVNKDPKNPGSTTTTVVENAMLKLTNGGDVTGPKNGFHDKLEQKSPGMYDHAPYRKEAYVKQLNNACEKRKVYSNPAMRARRR